MLQNTAGRNSGGMAAQLERDFGIDHLLGAYPGKVEMQNLLAEVIPLHVADQHRLGLTPQVKIGKMAWFF